MRARSLPVTLALLAGCSSGGDTAAAEEDCAFDNVDTYTAGIEKITGGGSFTVSIQSADPAPPDRGDNTWDLVVLDAAGAAVEGAAVVVTPYMPAHGHGTNPADFDGAEAGGGAYTAGPFDLFMPGLWEITVDVVDTTGASDDAIFTFCIEG